MKKTSKTDTPEKKVIYGKCEGCQTRIDRTLLYTVTDKKMCMSCGQQEIKRWNSYVREVEHG